MIFTKEFLDVIQAQTKISNRQLIEKDLILHKILLYLSNSEDFANKYAFKGGTCLTKAYLGYFRFSEDLDFTYINQKYFEKCSKKDIRRKINVELEKIISLLETISKKEGLLFSTEKSNSKYFEFGAGNVYTTFKIYYISLETHKEEFIKIQINFLEKLFFNLNERSLSSLIVPSDNSLFPEKYNWVFEKPVLSCYSLEEILSEKIRAIVTRQGVKSGDLIDVFMIQKKGSLDMSSFETEILAKIRFSLINDKYRVNLMSKKESIPSYRKGNEEKLLLVSLELDFYDTFLKELDVFLVRIIGQLQ